MDSACQFLYRLRPARPGLLAAGPTPDEARAIGEHVQYLAAAAQAGSVLLFGRTQNADDSTFGLVLLRFQDPASAQKFMHNDPAVRAGVMLADLFPFKIAGGCFRPPPAP